MTGSRARTERCVCGGLIVANEDAPGPAVLAHGRSPRHEAWRLGLEVVEGDPLLPTTDGKPTWALTAAHAAEDAA